MSKAARERVTRAAAGISTGKVLAFPQRPGEEAPMADANPCTNCQPGTHICIQHHREAMLEIEDRLGTEIRRLQTELTCTRANAEFMTSAVEAMQLPDNRSRRAS